MVLKSSIAIIGLFFLVSCGGNVKTGSPEDEKPAPNGSVLYTENCASCHGLDGAMGKAGSKDLTKTTMDYMQLKKVIEGGTPNGMPRFKEVLGGEKEVEAVVQHVMELKKN